MKAREVERQQAIANGLMDDPNARKSLGDAITLVGTCMDMCPRFERYRRERENNLMYWEQVFISSILPPGLSFRFPVQNASTMLVQSKFTNAQQATSPFRRISGRQKFSSTHWIICSTNCYHEKARIQANLALCLSSETEAGPYGTILYCSAMPAQLQWNATNDAPGSIFSVCTSAKGTPCRRCSS